MVARIVSIFLVMIMSFNSPVVCNAAYSDAIDVAGVYAGKIFDSVVMGEDNTILLQKIKSGIEDQENRAELIDYIDAAEKNNTKLAMLMMALPYPLAIWCDYNIPILGGIINTLITTPVAFVVEWLLSSSSDREDIQAFDVLREHYISSQFALMEYYLEENSDTNGIESLISDVRYITLRTEAELNEQAYIAALEMAHVEYKNKDAVRKFKYDIKEAGESIWMVLLFYLEAILALIYSFVSAICIAGWKLVCYYLGW